MSTNSRAPNLDQFIKPEKKKKYVTYLKGSKLYDLPYWTFVSLAKESGATVALRKTAIVDLIAFDKWIEEQVYEPEDKRMGRPRKKIENMDVLVARGKKYVRTNEAKDLYSIGRHTLERWAKDAGALRKVNGIVLVNIEKLDAFIEANEVEEDD